MTDTTSYSVEEILINVKQPLLQAYGVQRVLVG